MLTYHLTDGANGVFTTDYVPLFNFPFITVWPYDGPIRDTDWITMDTLGYSSKVQISSESANLEFSGKLGKMDITATVIDVPIIEVVGEILHISLNVNNGNKGE